MSTLEHALIVAARAHVGQVDKAGETYILHPIRVMQRLRGADERMAALLHDVVEDTSVTLDDLRREGFNEAVVRAVDHLTRRDDEDYNAFVRRAATDAVARAVKHADLQDNMDLTRLGTITDKDRERLTKYEAALQILDAHPS